MAKIKIDYATIQKLADDKIMVGGWASEDMPVETQHIVLVLKKGFPKEFQDLVVADIKGFKSESLTGQSAERAAVISGVLLELSSNPKFAAHIELDPDIASVGAYKLSKIKVAEKQLAITTKKKEIENLKKDFDAKKAKSDKDAKKQTATDDAKKLFDDANADLTKLQGELKPLQTEQKTAGKNYAAQTAIRRLVSAYDEQVVTTGDKTTKREAFVASMASKMSFDISDTNKPDVQEFKAKMGKAYDSMHSFYGGEVIPANEKANPRIAEDKTAWEAVKAALLMIVKILTLGLPLLSENLSDKLTSSRSAKTSFADIVKAEAEKAKAPSKMAL